jgi:hypothetical protein
MSTNKVQSRPAHLSDRIHCACGFNLNRANTDKATGLLESRLATRAHVPSSDTSAARGDAIAFICQKLPDAKTFVPNWDKFREFAAKITNACGAYVAGTYSEFVDYWSDTQEPIWFHYGYMGFTPGMIVCWHPDSHLRNRVHINGQEDHEKIDRGEVQDKGSV